MKNYKILYFIIGIFILSFLFGCTPKNKKIELTEEQVIIKNNTELFHKTLLKKVEYDKIVALNDLTPFEWNKVYFFDSYANKEYIYEKVGYEFDSIPDNQVQGLMQIVFMNENKVICHIHGFWENYKYYIKSDKEELLESDNPKFFVDKFLYYDGYSPELIYVE